MTSSKLSRFRSVGHWKWIAAAAAFTFILISGCTNSKKVEAPALSLRIAFTNIPLSYSPVILADSLGFFVKQGLSTTLETFPSGTKTMEALVGGSADIGTGSYDQNVAIAAEGRDVKTFVLMSLYPSRAVVLSTKGKAKIHRIEDLKGAAVGVGGFGSISHLFLQYLLVKHGIAPDAVKIVSIGTGPSAIASVEHQAVDAAVVSGSDRVVINKRVPGASTLLDVSGAAGCREVYGVDVYPTGAVFATGVWLHAHRETARRAAYAIQGALSWMADHTPEQIWDAIPARYRIDRELDLETLRNLMPSFSHDGVMPQDGAIAVRKSMSITSDKIRGANFDVASTYTNEFLPK